MGGGRNTFDELTEIIKGVGNGSVIRAKRIPIGRRIGQWTYTFQSVP